MTRLAAICAALGMALLPAAAAELQPGSYTVTYRLEVPHAERYARGFTARICVREGLAALPVLSANNPLRYCAADAIRIDGNLLSYRILCPGRRNTRSEALAWFRIAGSRFEGRIAMVMGGKNMTFTEVQSGRRTGRCAVAAAALAPG